MISSFDLTKLESLLKDFYKMTGIRITVFDESFQELVSYPEEIAPFCQLIRTDPAGATECLRCDQHACEIAAKRHLAYTYRCHAGLTESIAPLFMGNIVIGYLLFGHVFCYSSYEEGFAVIDALCSSYQLDPALLHETARKQKLVSEDYITSASHILQAVASYLCLERMAVLKQQALPVQIDAYISEHFAEPIDALSICRHFQIGKTQLYEIARQNYGMGIAEHVRKLRVNKAKELLTAQAELSITEIASLCGFKDYNYFITVFKRVTGITPNAYRRQNA